MGAEFAIVETSPRAPTVREQLDALAAVNPFYPLTLVLSPDVLVQVAAYAEAIARAATRPAKRAAWRRWRARIAALRQQHAAV